MHEHIVHGALLGELAAIQNGHLVADLADHGHFMGDEHHRDAQLPVDLLQQRKDALRGHGVQGAGRFVAKEHFRIAGQGAGNGDTLLLTTAELGRIGAGLVLQPYDL